MAKLSKIADRGRLPGFVPSIAPVPEQDGAKPAAAFRAVAFGAPYDEELLGSVFPVGSGSEVRFRMRRLRKVPVIMAVVLILTVWPGMPLTDSMLRVYFNWYKIETWWWYIPLTVLSLPVMWKQWMSSHAAAVAEAKTLIERMRAEVGGTVEESGR